MKLSVSILLPSRKVPTSYHLFEENGVTVNLPYIKPTDMLDFLFSTEPWLLLGGLKPGPGARSMLSRFWELYKSEHGSHQVYQMAAENKLHLDQTVPLILHGDAGRTLKKQPLEVVSFRPVLGIDTDEPVLKCSCSNSMSYHGLRKDSPMAQRLNNKNNSYLTHFLTFAFPSKQFKTTPGLLQSILEAMSKDLRIACCDGIAVGNTRYHVAVLGMAGDMEYHAKTGVLNRSYQNVGHRNFIPCCHECMAGSMMYPFEDVTSDPGWKNSLYQTVPWVQPPPFKHIPFDDWNAGDSARFFKRDPFHIFRLGIARNFIGSVIVLFCLEGVFDLDSAGRSIDLRLSRAWSSFSLWCDTHNVSPAGLRSFSKEKLHMPKMGTFPWCGGKGSDAIILLKWLKFLSGLHGAANPSSPLFPLVLRACCNGLSFQAIHRHGIWLKSSCRDRIMRCGKGFVQDYARLAKWSYDNRLQLFAMVPKIHAMDHFAVHLALLCFEEYACNPAVFDCSMSEDFIGQLSRQSRRISHTNVVENTILAYKVKARFVLKRFKKRKDK